MKLQTRCGRAQPGLRGASPVLEGFTIATTIDDRRHPATSRRACHYRLPGGSIVVDDNDHLPDNDDAAGCNGRFVARLVEHCHIRGHREMEADVG